MKKYIALMATALFALSVTACNTVRGAGQDVEEVGEEIQETTD